MRRCLIVLLLFAVEVHANPQRLCPAGVWTVDLVQKYQFRGFDLAASRGNTPPVWWKTQEGLAFISSKVLAIFQVQRMAQTSALSPRDVSGGSGLFVLHLSFLNAENGDQLRSIDLKTSGTDFSQVYPTHDGKFFVVTGELLRLYSSSFEETASKQLPKRHVALNEYWVVTVNNSGREILLEHHEYFGSKAPERTEYRLLNADNLETIDRSDGKAPDALKAEFSSYVERQLPTLSLLTKDEHVSSVLGNNSLLAAEVSRRHADPLDLGIKPSARRIIVYDRDKESERCSIPISSPVFAWGARLYTVSEDGTIAVIQNEKLSRYHP